MFQSVGLKRRYASCSSSQSNSRFGQQSSSSQHKQLHKHKHKHKQRLPPVGMIALFAVSFTVAIKLYNDAVVIENQRAKHPSSPSLSSESSKPEESITNYGPHRPTFVLHIGPSKTATSTLQIDCRKMQDQGILERDKTLFIGRASGIYRKTDPRLKWMSLSVWKDLH